VLDRVRAAGGQVTAVSRDWDTLRLARDSEAAARTIVAIEADGAPLDPEGVGPVMLIVPGPDGRIERLDRLRTLHVD
jgi:hypothetical protein